ncbi:MAG: hypothetical protein K9L75_05490 [Spirochaetia bacterium]|nr:hypothetical protein [Spirochaetia bacterium]
MIPIGNLAYYLSLSEIGYPISPLVIGLILGPMVDSKLRRALMVSEGSFTPMFTILVSLILLLVIVITIVSQLPAFKRVKQKVSD